MNNQSNLSRRLFSITAAAVLLLVLYCCTPAPAAEPADWTTIKNLNCSAEFAALNFKESYEISRLTNPLAGVVYEPLPEESGAGHE